MKSISQIEEEVRRNFKKEKKKPVDDIVIQTQPIYDVKKSERQIDQLRENNMQLQIEAEKYKIINQNISKENKNITEEFQTLTRKYDFVKAKLSKNIKERDEKIVILQQQAKKDEVSVNSLNNEKITIQNVVDQLKVQLESQNKDINSKILQINTITQENKEITQQLIHMKKDHQQVGIENLDVAEKYKVLSEQYQQLQVEHNEWKELVNKELDENQTKIQYMNDRNKEMIIDNQKDKEIINEQNVKIQKQKQKHNQLQETHKIVEQKYMNLNDDFKSNQNNNVQNIDSQTQIIRLESSIQHLNHDNEQQKHQIQEQVYKINVQEKEILYFKNELESLKGENNFIKQEKQTYHNEFTEIKNRYEIVVQKLSKQINQLTINLHEANEENITLKERLETMDERIEEVMQLQEILSFGTNSKELYVALQQLNTKGVQNVSAEEIQAIKDAAMKEHLRNEKANNQFEVDFEKLHMQDVVKALDHNNGTKQEKEEQWDSIFNKLEKKQ